MQKEDVNDVFFLEKSGLIESITDLLLRLDIKTVCLDGRWGTGKTFFCHRLIKHLEEQTEVPLVLYMDCFEEDSVNEPMLSLMTLLYQAVDEDIKQKLANCVARVLKATAWVGAASAINMVIPGQGKTIVDNLTKSNNTRNLLETYADKRKTLDELKGLLNRIVETKQVIFVLDELDRCRPDYAVKVLESVKHIFNVEKVGFVFSVNESILRQSIAHVYGMNDCCEYLDKFFERRVSLPHNFGNRVNGVNNDCRAYAWLLNRLNFLEKNIKTNTHYILQNKSGYSYCDDGGVNVVVMKEVLEGGRRTIRDAENIMRYAEFVYKNNSTPSIMESRLYLASILYFIYFHDEANRLVSTGVEKLHVSSVLRKVFPVIENNSQTKYVISAIESICQGEIENDMVNERFLHCLRMVAGFSDK